MWRSIQSISGVARAPGAAFVIALALGVLAFLLAVGLGPDALPYPLHSPYSDAAISHWPNALYIHRNGFALWNPRLMSGLPFAANPLSKVWYPPQWAALILEPTLHLNLMIWLHLTLAGAGLWVWARASGLGAGPAALAAVAYTFAPKTVAHLGAGHLDLVYAMAWFPWLLWAVYTALVADANRTRASLRLGAVAALLLLADIRLSAYAFVTAGGYAVWRLRKLPPYLYLSASSPTAIERRTARRIISAPINILRAVRRGGSETRPYYATCFMRQDSTLSAPGFPERREGARGWRAAPLFVGGIFSIALTAAQWIPLLALSPYLSRASLTLQEAAAFSLEPGHLLGVVLGRHASLHETMTYAGLCALILAAIALLAYPRRLAFWALVIVVAALYALGDHGPLWPLLAGAFPPLLWLRIPSRAWFVVALVLPYLAGWGAQALAGAATRLENRRARLVIVTLLAASVMCGGASALALTGALGAETALAALVVALATAAVVLPALRRGRGARYVVPLLTVIALADLLWIDRTLVEGRGRKVWLDPYQELAGYLVEAGAGRVYTPSDSLPQQAAAFWEINQFGGVDPFQVASYVDMARRATRIPYDGYAPTIPPYTGEGPVETMWAGVTPDAGLMSLWNVTHVVSAFPLEGEGWRLDRRIGAVYVYANQVQRGERSAFVSGLPDGASAFTLPGYPDTTMVSVPYVSGWTAEGLRAGPHALTAVQAPGDQPIQLRYSPRADLAGMAISAGTVIAWLLLYARARRRSASTVRDEKRA